MAEKNKSYEYEVKDLEDSQKEVVIKVNPVEFSKIINSAYEKLAVDVKIQGFRPGNAPRNLIEAKLGARLFEEAINQALPVVTSFVITESKLVPLDYADYKIIKVSKDEGLEYSATFTVMPEVKLPEFKSLKTKKGTVEIVKKELDESFDRLVDSILNAANKPAEEKEGEKAKKGKKEEVKSEKAETKKLTAKDIDWAKELKDEALKTEADVKKRLEDVMKSRREVEIEEKYIDELVKEAVAKTGIKAPKTLIADEVAQMERSYSQRIEQIGLKVEDFLKSQKTTLEDMRKNWEEDAQFKIAADLLFASIAKAHDIRIETTDVDSEIEKIEDVKLREQYSNSQGRSYISSVLVRQRALLKLRELAGDKTAKMPENTKPVKKDEAAHDHDHSHDGHDHSHEGHDHDHHDHDGHSH
jgi:trigger factor